MKNAMLCLLGLLLLVGGPAVGQEANVLEQLDGRLGRLVDRADAATVKIILPRAFGWRDLPDPRSKEPTPGIEWVYAVLGKSVTAWSSVAGVLVGKPPVLVTSADAVGEAKTVRFELADGTSGSAKLKGIDRDLGVAVFALPTEVAAGREGLEVSTFKQVGRGRLVLVSGPGKPGWMRPLSLALIRGSAPLGEWFVVDGLSDELLPGQPAIAMDGRLLGVAARTPFPAPGQRRRPLVLTGEFLSQTGVVTVNPRVEGDTPDARIWTYWMPEEPAGSRLPRGAFIQCWAIARVLEDLKEHGKVRHSYLGVVLGQVRGKGEDRGVQVLAVLQGSPAEAAGIKAGAVIRSVNGVPVEKPDLITRALVLFRPGDSLRIQLTTVDEVLTVVLGDRDKATRALLTPSELGLTCIDLGADLASFLQLPEGTNGVVVRNVLPGSAAAQAGLARGQVIVAGGGEAIADLEELRAAVAGAKGELKLVVLAGGERRTVAITFQAKPPPRKAR